MDALRVLIADDHPIFRNGMRALLTSLSDLEVAGEAVNGDEAIDLAASLQPDVVLMDLHMPGGVGGIEATRRILAISPHIRVLVVTMFEDDDSVFAALRAGARGYLLTQLAISQCYRSVHAHQHPEERVLLRLDGQYSTEAVLADLAGLPFVMRGKDYQILKRAEIQARLKLPADQHLTHPESGMVRALYDCPDVPVGPDGVQCRVVVATHPEGRKKSRIGVTRAGVVYELFFSRLAQQAFTASDVVALYLHRGTFETTLADEDQE
jgi:CheY-like chemotaxis protein